MTNELTGLTTFNRLAVGTLFRFNVSGTGGTVVDRDTVYQKTGTRAADKWGTTQGGVRGVRLTASVTIVPGAALAEPVDAAVAAQRVEEALDELRAAMVVPAQNAIRLLAERLTGGYSAWQVMADADGVFGAAATVDAWARVTFLHGKGVSLESIAGILRDDVCRDAMYPPRSTSPCTNLSAQCRTQAQAAIADRLLELAGRTR